MNVSMREEGVWGEEGVIPRTNERSAVFPTNLISVESGVRESSSDNVHQSILYS